MKVKVILFGAGKDLRPTYNCLNLNQVEIVAISDNDSSKWGQIEFGIEIIKPDCIFLREYDYICISSSSAYDEIEYELSDKGLKNIISVYSYTDNESVARFVKDYFSVKGKKFLKRYYHQIEIDFYPTYKDIFYNPYYFARRNIVLNIEEFKHYIKGRCLDFGCGNKPYERLLDINEYIGVEIENNKRKKGIVYYDGKYLPFEENYFDSILCSQVFEHIPNLDEIMIELNRVLKKGGYALVTVPFTYVEHLVPFDYRRFTSYGVRRFFEENGFEVIEFKKSGSYMEVLAQFKNIYIVEKLFKGNYKKGYMRLITGLVTVGGIIMAKAFPNYDRLYLDNVIVVRKRDDVFK